MQNKVYVIALLEPFFSKRARKAVLSGEDEVKKSARPTPKRVKNLSLSGDEGIRLANDDGAESDSSAIIENFDPVK